MPDTLPTSPSPSLKEQYVPPENRASQHVRSSDFVKEWLVILGITAMGAFIGRMAGQALEPRKISLGKYGRFFNGTGILDKQLGTWVGGKIGGIYGLFHHWKQTEKKRMGVANISSDLKPVLDPDELERVAKKEESFVSDLKQLHELQNTSKSHAANISERRETQAASTERSA